MRQVNSLAPRMAFWGDYWGLSAALVLCVCSASLVCLQCLFSVLTMPV